MDHKLWQKTNIFKILASNQEMGYTHMHTAEQTLCAGEMPKSTEINLWIALLCTATTDWHRQEAILVSCANTNIDTHTVHNNKCVCVT